MHQVHFARAAKSALALICITSAFALGGCGNSEPPAASATAAAGLKAAGEAGIGDKTMCPISKEEFTVTAQSPKAEYQGKTYYFCCPGCDAKFKSDPAKYLKPAT